MNVNLKTAYGETHEIASKNIPDEAEIVSVETLRNTIINQDYVQVVYKMPKQERR